MLFLAIWVNIPVAPAPAALVAEFPAVRWNNSIPSNPRQVLLAPVSRMKFPFVPLMVAFINRCCVLDTLKFIFLYPSFLRISCSFFMDSE